MRRLTLEDDTGNFDCGEQPLNEYIWLQAVDQQAEGAAIVYLAWFDAQIVGFSSLNMSSIQVGDVAEQHRPRRTPYPHFPALMIGRLATDSKCFRQGIGTLLCQHAISTAFRLREDVGCQFIIVNAKEKSVEFYQKCGFNLDVNQPKSRREPFMYFKLPSD